MTADATAVSVDVENRPQALAAPRPLSLSTALASVLGNVLEWYDFAVYGFLASIFAKNFFPAEDPVVSLIGAFGVFAASFLTRPLGGIIFGHVGDRYGRRVSLVASVILMSVSTVAIGLLPTYATLGVLAPCLLLVLRLLQGVSLGGEYTTSSIVMAEASLPRWRCLLTGLTPMGVLSGMLLGSGVGALMASLVSQDDLVAWGWRIPFLLGLVLGGGTMLLRRGMQETEGPKVALAEAPMVVAFTTEWRNILRGAILSASLGSSFYILFVYLPTYLQQVDHLPERAALQINTVSVVVLLVLVPISCMLSDMIGRKAFMVGAQTAFILFVWPLFRMLSGGSEREVIVAQLCFAVLVSAATAPVPCMLAEMFSRAVRCSAMSFSYNLAAAVTGGTAPMVAVYLVNRLQEDMGPAIYLMAIGVMSLGAALTTTDRSRQALD